MTYRNAFVGYGHLSKKLNRTAFIFVVVGVLLVLVSQISAMTPLKHEIGKTVLFQPVNIVFQPASGVVPAGFIADNGLAYDVTRGYGWVNPVSKLPIDFSANMRLRSDTGDSKLLGIAQMQPTKVGQNPGSWEFALPNGLYRVTVGAGDGTSFDSDNQINVEGLPVISDFLPDVTHKHLIATAVVQVSDGKLTVDANGGQNSKLNFITILPYTTLVDVTSPTISVRTVGTLQSATTYINQVQIFAKAIDVGPAGLKTFLYSLNGAAYLPFTTPLVIFTAGSYSITFKATDANSNQIITAPLKFSVIIKNTGAYMVLENTNAFPGNDHLVFSDLQNPWRRTSPDTTPFNANHNIVKLRVNNYGTGNLIINNLTLSRPANWKIIAINSDSTSKLPVVITPQKFADISINFSALNAATRIKIFHDTLYVTSNDSIAPLKKVMLDGLWQLNGEGLREPWTQDIFSLYNYKTNTGFNHDDNGLKGTAVVPNTSEVAAAYFLQADPSRPVTVYEIAQYHGCCKAVSPFTWYVKGTTTVNTLFTTNYLDGQSVLPRQLGSNGLLAKATFNSSNSFGFTSDFSIFSDRAENYMGKIGIRFWKVIDANGNIVPNAYLAGVDYLGTPFSNSDYNDDIYYIDNIKPDTGPVFNSVLQAIPEDVDFGASLTGNTKTVSIMLFNSGMNYPGEGSDPSVAIKSVQIVGPNASEFSAGVFTTTAIKPQGSVNLTLNFKPQTLGIKNAAVLISYGNSSPLRVPLYGVANTSISTISLVKRYKGGSDVDLKINNQVWSSDKSIRFGSVKLDHQAVLSPVLCTTADSLYQTYLSAAVNLGVTNYEIPVTNGTYMVRMHFVENFFTAEAGRIFNITIENKPALLDFDIYKEVGYRTALVKDFLVNVADGHLSIKFSPAANRVALAGIEIFQAAANPVPGLLPNQTLALKTDSTTNNVSNFKLTIYPNPGDGNIVNFKATNFKPLESVDYTITDIFGKVVKRDRFAVDNAGFAEISVPMTAKLSMGIYVINSVSLSGSCSAKFVVK